jgi:curved DNA-binding protein CbpA
MLMHYFKLGVSPEASDEEIRAHYIELVKRHTPEKDPLRFREITAAYDAVKDLRKRLVARYLPPENHVDAEQILTELARSVVRERKRVGLKDLIRDSMRRAAS